MCDPQWTQRLETVSRKRQTWGFFLIYCTIFHAVTILWADLRAQQKHRVFGFWTLDRNSPEQMRENPWLLFEFLNISAGFTGAVFIVVVSLTLLPPLSFCLVFSLPSLPSFASYTTTAEKKTSNHHKKKKKRVNILTIWDVLRAWAKFQNE